MMTSVRTYPILWFCGFILLTAAQAHAQELYLKSGPVAAGASMTVGDLVVTMNGGAPGADAPLLNAPLPELSAIPALIPARDIRAAIAPILRRSIVIVGGPLVYLPATVTDKSEIRFYEALLEHLGRHLPDVRIEAAIPEGRSPDLSGIQGALQFQLPGGEDSASALLRNRFVEYRGEYDADWSFVPIRFRA
ncbi:MAG TPA: hypothetical protein VMW69_02200, partial [Spirochaetia bacterium]|nr:hypothetical protein [Spirochaetia bacterium]